MTHGTCHAYVNGCRCDRCTRSNRLYQRDYQREYRRDHRTAEPIPLPDENRRHCLICGTALNVHPIRACWRELR